jgi:hypothetical protein
MTWRRYGDDGERLRLYKIPTMKMKIPKTKIPTPVYPPLAPQQQCDPILLEEAIQDANNKDDKLDYEISAPGTTSVIFAMRCEVPRAVRLPTILVSKTWTHTAIRMPFRRRRIVSSRTDQLT